MIQGISILLIFLGNLIMARWAGAYSYGKYVHVFNWISILSMVALWGQEDVAIAEIPKYTIDGYPGRIYSFIRSSNSNIILSSFFVTALFLAIIYRFPLKTLHENRHEFLLAAAGIYLTTFLTLNQNILQALNYIRLSQLVEKCIKPFLLIVLFVGARWLSLTAGSGLLIVIAVVVMAVCCIVLGGILFQKIRRYRMGAGRGDRRENMRWRSFHFFSIDLLTLLSAKITMLVLPYFSMQKEVGIYNIIYRFADLVIYPFFLMSAVIPQLFARHYASEVARKQSLYSQSTKLMMVFSLPLLLINILAGRMFLGWFGRDFPEGYSGLIYLSLAQFLFSFFGPAHYILTMQGKEKYAVFALVIYAVVLFFANIWLVPVLGIKGGAIGVLIGSLFYNGALAAMAYRLCGVASPFILFVTRPFRK